MKIVIGLDIGGSTTKVVGFQREKLLEVTYVRSSDPVAAAYGGIGKFLNVNKLKLDDVEQIRMTGVGSSYITQDFFEIETVIANEFEAVGLGGLYISQIDEAVVISIGTGTSFVYSNKIKTEHIIGSGIGGGSILGLSNKILNFHNFDIISDFAEKGDLTHIDLLVRDISKKVPGLHSDATASNFGNVNDDAKLQDLACGIVNMVFQSIGTMAILAARLKKVNNIIFVGSVVHIPRGQKSLRQFVELYDVNVILPENARFATAIGAALCSNYSKLNR
ncbi:MAG: type II pantothenate kinase [Clostridiaceae bacterium]|nr:type II pantothenate kinase [Clostridiaceae bacterium]